MSHTTTPTKTRWNHAFQRLWTLHWVMAACFLIIYLAGFVMARVPHTFLLRESLYDVHKSFGILVLGMLLVRVLMLLQVFSEKYLKRHPRFTNRWLRTVALHSLLYGLMLGVPVSGIWLSNAGGHDVPFFWLTLPRFFAVNRPLGAIAHSFHFWLAYSLLALVVLHMAEQRLFLRKFWLRKLKA